MDILEDMMTWLPSSQGSRGTVAVQSTRLSLCGLPKIEASRWRAYQRLQNIWRRLEALAVSLLTLGGEAHAKNEHGEWLLYRAENSPSDEYPEWVTWYWDQRLPFVDVPKHQDIGQQIHDLMMFAMRDNGRRRVLTEAALERCIQNTLALQAKKHGRVARLPVNGRDYWYSCSVNPSGYGRWEKLLWPEDDTVVVDTGPPSREFPGHGAS